MKWLESFKLALLGLQALPQMLREIQDVRARIDSAATRIEELARQIQEIRNRLPF